MLFISVPFEFWCFYTLCKNTFILAIGEIVPISTKYHFDKTIQVLFSSHNWNCQLCQENSVEDWISSKNIEDTTCLWPLSKMYPVKYLRSRYSLCTCTGRDGREEWEMACSWGLPGGWHTVCSGQPRQLRNRRFTASGSKSCWRWSNFSSFLNDRMV